MGQFDTKINTLDSIIDLMDTQMLGKAKRKGAPAVQAPLAPQAEAAAEVVPEAGLDPDTERQLMELYESADEPTPVNASY